MTGGPRRRTVLAVLLGLLVGALAAPLPGYAEADVTVTGVRQEPGLLRLELVARDLGAGQRLDLASVSVEVGGTPLAVVDTQEVSTIATESEAVGRLAVLVVDVSDSMLGQPLADAVAAAARYADGLPADVEMAVVTVGATARTVLEPTADRAEVHRVLDGLVTEGATALYDGLAAAADLVADSTAYPERRVLVLSDGADSGSATSLAEVEQRLAEVATPVDTVAFRTGQTVADLLAGLSEGTGGQAYLAEDAADLASAFGRAAAAFTVRLAVTAEVPAELSGTEADLAVSVAAGDQRLSTSVPVAMAAYHGGSGALVTVPSGGLPPLAEGGLVALVFLALLVLGLVVFSPLLDLSRRRRRLAQVERFSVLPPPRPVPTPGTAGSPVARAALAWSEKVVRSRGAEGRIALQLDRAGMRLRPHEWLLLRALVCLTAVLLLALFVGPLPAVPLGVVAGWVGTWLYQQRRAEHRREAFATLLPDALQLVIGSLKSGFSLSQAIDAMARELPDPVANEFGRALGEARLGVNLDDALERVAIRMRNSDLAWAVVAIRVQQEVGGNLAEVLTTTVTTIRERNSLRRHVRALSAEGRLSAWILVALPIAAAAFMFVFRREYVRTLYTEPLGLMMLAAGIVLVVLGAAWMSRVVKVEV